jgi:hypothetical protein
MTAKAQSVRSEIVSATRSGQCQEQLSPDFSNCRDRDALTERHGLGHDPLGPRRWQPFYIIRKSFKTDAHGQIRKIHSMACGICST